MEKPKVFFTDMRCGIDESLLDKTRRLVKAAGIDGIGMDKKFVAIKMHFGELGNLSFLRPNFPRTIAGIVRENGGIPYLTDCNTLYPGSRKNAVEHLECAEINGFNSVSAGCRIIIGDGLRGTDDVEIPVDGEYVKAAKIGRAIADCDVLITLTHFKCHEITGFGGAIKNLAMGCASRRGKMEMHSAGKPSLNPDKCVGCGRCVKSCGQNAIRIANKKAEINGELPSPITVYIRFLCFLKFSIVSPCGFLIKACDHATEDYITRKALISSCPVSARFFRPK